jgi:hypothetical protein
MNPVNIANIITRILSEDKSKIPGMSRRCDVKLYVPNPYLPKTVNVKGVPLLVKNPLTGRDILD